MGNAITNKRHSLNDRLKMSNGLTKAFLQAGRIPEVSSARCLFVQLGTGQQNVRLSVVPDLFVQLAATLKDRQHISQLYMIIDFHNHH